MQMTKKCFIPKCTDSKQKLHILSKHGHFGFQCLLVNKSNVALGTTASQHSGTVDSDICQPENRKTEFDTWYIRILIINFIKFPFISHVWHSESSICEKNIIFIYII